MADKVLLQGLDVVVVFLQDWLEYLVGLRLTVEFNITVSAAFLRTLLADLVRTDFGLDSEMAFGCVDLKHLDLGHVGWVVAQSVKDIVFDYITTVLHRLEMWG